MKNITDLILNWFTPDSLKDLPDRYKIESLFFNFFGQGHYYHKNDIPGFSQLGITNVEVERRGGELVFIIHLLKPGLLIGKDGATIDRFTTHLSKCLKESVRVDLKETHPFASIKNKKG